jgi:hypothetical protein
VECIFGLSLGQISGLSVIALPLTRGEIQRLLDIVSLDDIVLDEFNKTQTADNTSNGLNIIPTPRIRRFALFPFHTATIFPRTDKGYIRSKRMVPLRLPHTSAVRLQHVAESDIKVPQEYEATETSETPNNILHNRPPPTIRYNTTPSPTSSVHSSEWTDVSDDEILITSNTILDASNVSKANAAIKKAEPTDEKVRPRFSQKISQEGSMYGAAGRAEKRVL